MAGKPRPTYREVPQWVVIRLLKGLRKVEGVAWAVHRYLTTGDTWALFRYFGIRNWWPIRHDGPDKSHPSRAHYERYRERYDAEGEVPFDVYGASSLKTSARSGRTMGRGSVEPLGPEDYELGLQVPPGTPDEQVEAIYTRTTEVDVELAYRAFNLKMPSHYRKPVP